MQNEFADSPLSVVDLVVQSGPLAKGVLLILLIFSMISWAIILQKWVVFRTARKEDGRFLANFSKTQSLTNIYNSARDQLYSPVSRVFLTGYRELYLFQEMAKKELNQRESSLRAKEPGISETDLKGISLALNKAINKEIERLSHRLDFLATTGSTTPFIGLFGTVWGIMHSFRSIGIKGTASIGGVAPGIAEALIATAAGLAAAIPAVIFYNYYNDKIRLFTSTMDDFSHDFLYLAEKNFTVKKPEPQSIDFS